MGGVHAGEQGRIIDSLPLIIPILCSPSIPPPPSSTSPPPPPHSPRPPVAAGLPSLSAQADLPVCGGAVRPGPGLPRRVLLVRADRQPAQAALARQVPQGHRGARQGPPHPPPHRGKCPALGSQPQNIRLTVPCNKRLTELLTELAANWLPDPSAWRLTEL